MMEFEERNVEHGVNFHGCGELQSVGLGADSFDNRKGAKAFPIQLLRRTLGRDVRGGKSNFIADRELDMFVLGVVVMGLVILCGLDTFDEIVMMRSKGFRESFSGRNRQRGRTEVDHELGMEAVVGVKRRTVDRGLMRVVVRKFGERQEIRPIVLLIVAIDAEILFDGLVHTFSLTVSLGVESRRQSTLQIHHGCKRIPKMRCEDRSTVGDKRFRDAVQANDVIEKQACELGRTGGFETRNKVTHLREAVDENKEGIVTIRGWEVGDEIARDRLPRTGGCGQRRELTMLKVTWGLTTGTRIAGGDIGLDKCMHAGEPIIARQQFKGFLRTEVTGERVIVVLTQ